MFDNFRFDIFFVCVSQLLTAYVIFGLFAWKKYLTIQLISLRSDLVTLALKISEIDSKLNNKEDDEKEIIK
jgi:hypothetical protein